MKKRLSTILATLLMTVTLIPFAPVHAKAASADVTRQMAGNRQIKDISKKMTAYTTAMNISVWSTTKPVKMKLNDNQKLSIAVFVRYNYKGDYSYTAKELRSETKKLFGKSASVSKIKSSKKNKNQAMFVCSSDSKFYKKNNNSPLKIAVLGHKTIPSSQGGIEIVVEELTVRMAKLGHKITVW